MAGEIKHIAKLAEGGATMSVHLGAESGFVEYLIGFVLEIEGRWMLVGSAFPEGMEHWHDVVISSFKGSESGASFRDQHGRACYVKRVEASDRELMRIFKAWQKEKLKMDDARLKYFIDVRKEDKEDYIGDVNVS